MGTVYLNGDYLAAADAVVSVDDRGFLFGDACYEVSVAYEGRFLRLDRHLERLQRSLDAIRIDFDAATLEPMHHDLLVRNDLAQEPLAVFYTQVTRGVAARNHAFPVPAVSPTVYAFARAREPVTDAEFESGSSAITVPDDRWANPSIKTTVLLPNVLAQQAAVEAGASDAIMVLPGGSVTEGALDNVFLVVAGVLVTPPADRRILAGVTRELVIELARRHGIGVVERAVTVEELRDAEEVFVTGTTIEVRPIVSLDGVAVGEGAPGPVTRLLRQAYLDVARNR